MPRKSNETEQPAKEDFVTKTALLARAGWSRRLLSRFAPEPDATKVNPHYRSGAPLCLYRLRRIEQIEGTVEFQQAVLAQKPHRDRGAKAAATKRRATDALISQIRVHVRVMERDKLVQKACAHYNTRQREREMWADSYGEPAPAASPRSNPAFLLRITVNYVRHNLTSYDDHLDRVAGLVGNAEARNAIRAKVFEAIAAAYPFLAEECQRQRMARDDLDMLVRAHRRSPSAGA